MTIKAQYNGKTILPDDKGREYLEAFKAKLSEGDYVALTFEEWGKARSRLQQALFHGILGRFSRRNKEPMEVVKIRWKVDQGHYLPADKILSGEIDPPEWRGKFVDLHDVYPRLHPERTIVLLRSEADYTTRMENDLIDYAIDSCHGSGVDITDIELSLQGLRS